MENWIPLTDEQYRIVWDKFYEVFNFNPSTRSKDWPSYTLPNPYITYKITEHKDSDIDDLEEKCINALKAITEQDEYVFALDWQHESFLYYPHLEKESAKWKMPFYPDGDYYFYLHNEFKWGYLGHPWEQTITIFGAELLQQFEINFPSILGKVVRQS
ncbi:DUF2716 domain-containing protein [Paenibacillus urinalis]|uniref:DUF2716 domain-containing protein n=1 Tax=Paenibacillus urinalis TaxID=521520 RepID=A0ABY7XFZ2_9BACL|nr:MULTISPECIES: DUF2716 domain-containing protein [Paenibacillus]WDH95473.1 DUF2716 domain-containing protein [Paenibacillus urinalis]WDI03671.1 DUF2716 domain-containing protein [Paenibacillus urinalis]GAK38997.1 hypothetical protein TCA2_0723 [Paenibacillus sp. TCA20]